MSFTVGSLFDGSGGFPLAAFMSGGTPIWASEIEPYPIAVTKSRFPQMKHLGSVTDINGAEVEPVDVITFGSPCQDLSVAGKRAGLKHEDNGDEETTRSGLFMEAVRIIKEMREATNGVYPRFALWENVPGAFSSNKGEDFRLVLEELIKICEPKAVMPCVPKRGWAYADHYRGHGWSLAYRTFDAQYWGVPQRRRRIYLVLDLTGFCAGEILFERDGLRGYFAEGRAPWQRITTDAERGTGANDNERTDCTTLKCYDIGEARLRTPTEYDNLCPTITARCGTGGNNVPCVILPSESKLFENHSQDTRYRGPLDVAQPVTATYGLGGNNQPFVVSQHPFCKSSRAKSADDATTWKDCKITNTLNTFDLGEIRVNEIIVEKHPTVMVYCVQGSMIGRADKNGPQGDGVNKEISFTLNTTDRHAVSYRYIVRRLTPTECARLQGFADQWAVPDAKTEFSDKEYKFWLNVRNNHAEINGKQVKDYTEKQMLTWYNKLHTDSSEYKLWGNGIALPCALYVMQGIADALNKN